MDRLASVPRTERGPDGGDYQVRRLPSAAKEYTCPACLRELRPETWTLLMVAVMRLPVGSDPGILPGSGP